MPGLVPGIHAFDEQKQDVDGRDEPGHDEVRFVDVAHDALRSPPLISLRRIRHGPPPMTNQPFFTRDHDAFIPAPVASGP
jgi:hypothetical protein